MDRIDVNAYDGDVNFESDDERVTKALIFYLKAKSIAEVANTVGVFACLGGAIFAAYKIFSVLAGMMGNV